MHYVFNTEHAVKYGLKEAIFLYHVMFWVEKNKANNANERDGKYWTYNSISALKKIFPFWTESVIWRVVQSLKRQKAIEICKPKGNDRTCWYTTSHENEICIFQKREMHFSEMKNDIYSINTDKNTYISEVFAYYLLKTKKKFSLTPARRRVIERIHKLKIPKEDAFKAIDNFCNDDWEGRARFMDVVYCLGQQRGGVDNFDKWFNYDSTKVKSVGDRKL